jgi:hypothetical protein
MHARRRFSDLGSVLLLGGLFTLSLAACGTEDTVGTDIAEETGRFAKQVEDVLQTKMEL